MKRGFALLALLAFLGGAAKAAPQIRARLFVDYEEGASMKAGAPSDWVVEIYDPDSPEAIHHFHVMHEKEIHLLVVSEDLSHFVHLHPAPLGNHTGLFGITVNQLSPDVDTFDAVSAVPFAGRYFVYAEAMPMGFQMLNLPMNLQVDGQARIPEPFVVDPISPEGAIVKEQDGYRISVVPKPFLHCNRLSVILKARLESLTPGGSYESVQDLSTWLGSYGHAVMISQQGETAEAKTVRHLHAVWPLPDDPDGERGPEIEISAENHGPFAEGVYRAWIQLKHRGRVLTFPVTFELKLPSAFMLESVC